MRAREHYRVQDGHRTQHGKAAFLQYCAQTPIYIAFIWYGSRMLSEGHEQRLKSLKGKVEPTFYERLMGYACILVLLANTYFKCQTETLIFIVMPCHLMTVS